LKGVLLTVQKEIKLPKARIASQEVWKLASQEAKALKEVTKSLSFAKGKSLASQEAKEA
jgi:hypothetical protein